MDFFVEIVISLLVLLSASFIMIASIGLLKFNALPVCLHTVGLSSTVGIMISALASSFYFSYVDRISLHEILIALLVMISGPVVSLFIAKIYMFEHKRDLPIPDGTDWVTATDSKKASMATVTVEDQADIARLD